MGVSVLRKASSPMLIATWSGRVLLTNQTAIVVTIPEIKNINQCTIEYTSRLVSGTEGYRSMVGRFKRYSASQFYFERPYGNDGMTVEIAYTVKEYASNIRVDEILTNNLYGYKNLTIPAIKDLSKQFYVPAGCTSMYTGGQLLLSGGYMTSLTNLLVYGYAETSYLLGGYVVSW